MNPCAPLLAVLLGGPLTSPAPAQQVEFGPREAEHLLNRAGFGATPEAVAQTARLGLAAAVDALFAPPVAALPAFESVRTYVDAKDLKLHLAREGIPPDEATEGQLRRKWDQLTLVDRHQLSRYTRLWIERMVRGEDPLRDRMALFWHGHFATSMGRVQNSHDIVLQQQMLRELAFGPFEEQVLAVAKSPAMLEYLGNRANRLEHPNENFARELMELFTLSPGHYTELDVREAARALTGYTIVDGEFAFLPERHDDEPKRVLGVEANLDGPGLVRLLLAQPACARYLAAELLRWFEGVDAAPQRVEAYAETLRGASYRFEPFLRRLFADPHFYSDAVVGRRISGPFDFAVGTARRLEVELPPSAIETAGRVMGMRLFYPETVKGWEDGFDWMTTSTVVARANFAAVVVGVLPVSEFVQAARSALHGGGSMMAMAAESADESEEELAEAALLAAWRSDFGAEFEGAALDQLPLEDFVERLLAVQPTAQELESLRDWLREHAHEFEGAAGVPALAHRVLLLPSAHLH